MAKRSGQSTHRVGVYVYPANGHDRGVLRTMLYEDIVCWLEDVEKLGKWGFTGGANPGVWMQLKDEYDLQYARYHAEMALKSMKRHGFLESYEWASNF